MPDLSEDVLMGAEAIAQFMGMRTRQVYYAAEQRNLPLFKIGSMICARKSTLVRWIAEREMVCSLTTEGPG